MNLFLFLILIGASSVYGAPQINSTTTPSPPLKLKCQGKLSKVSNSDELFDSLLPQILKSSDTEQEVIIKREFLNYLTKSDDFNQMVKCSIHAPRLLQEDGDDDDDGGGGGGGNGGLNAINTLAFGQGGNNGNPYDNSNVLLGVRRILANVFTGNLVGIIQESVGLRSPEGVTNVFTDVLSTLFGSMATAGITGIVGNITTTISPYVNDTEQAYYKQLYQQQAYIQQLQQQGVLQQAQAIGLHHQIVNQRLQLQHGQLTTPLKQQQQDFNKVILLHHQENQQKHLQQNLAQIQGTPQQQQQSQSPSQQSQQFPRPQTLQQQQGVVQQQQQQQRLPVSAGGGGGGLPLSASVVQNAGTGSGGGIAASAVGGGGGGVRNTNTIVLNPNAASAAVAPASSSKNQQEEDDEYKDY